ncbi:MAG: hypothetical protein ACRCSF_11245 [Mycobacteriaceae bacterium]
MRWMRLVQAVGLGIVLSVAGSYCLSEGKSVWQWLWMWMWQNLPLWLTGVVAMCIPVVLSRSRIAFASAAGVMCIAAVVHLLYGVIVLMYLGYLVGAIIQGSNLSNSRFDWQSVVWLFCMFGAAFSPAIFAYAAWILGSRAAELHRAGNRGK